MSRNLPCRVTSSTSVPSSADSGGSKVFSALNAARWTVTIARSASRPLQVEGQRLHLGQLGHEVSLGDWLRITRCCRLCPGPLPRLGDAEHNGAMPAARPLPSTGSIFLDARGRRPRAAGLLAPESGLVVLSLWRDNVCAGSFRLAVEEVPDLIESLRAGLDAAYATRATPPSTGRPDPARATQPRRSASSISTSTSSPSDQPSRSGRVSPLQKRPGSYQLVGRPVSSTPIAS